MSFGESLICHVQQCLEQSTALITEDECNRDISPIGQFPARLAYFASSIFTPVGFANRSALNGTSSHSR